MAVANTFDDMRPRNTLPSAEELRSLFLYDATDGTLEWRRRTSIRVMAGQKAGTKMASGHIGVGIRGVKYYAHRIVWKMATGEDAESVDHIDGNPANNRIENLRSVSHVVNMQNIRSANSDNTSGLLGAHKARNKWAAVIKVDGRRVRLGLFKTPEEAHAAYLAAKRVLHAGCTI